MRVSVFLRTFFIALIISTAASGFAVAQSEEETLSSYYDEIAAGTVTGSDASEPTSEDAEQVEEDSNGAAKNDVKPWLRNGTRRHLSLNGATGLFRIIEGGSGEQGTLGGGFHGGYFRYSDYLVDGDKHSSMWSGLNLRVTPFSFLEVYLGAQTNSNHNTLGNPQLYQTIGNVELGLKGFFTVADWITFAGLFGTEFKNPVGAVDMSFEGTSFDLALISTFDFSELNEKVPFRAHLNFGYKFDNSAKVVENLEWERGGCSQDVNEDGVLDFEGCLDPIERKSLDIDRNDQFRIGAGVDALFPYVSPLVEYWLDIPVNRQDFVCPEDIPGSYDSCMLVEGFSGVRQWLTLGVRVLPPVDSLAIDIGFDIGLKGWGPTVHEMAPQDPYRFIFGLSYAFNMKEKIIRAPVCDQTPVPAVAPKTIPKEGIITGFVHDKNDAEKVINGATITYKDMALEGQMSDSYGKFISHPIPLGAVTIQISAEGYEPGSFDVTIPHPVADKENPGKEDLANPYKIEVEYDFPLMPVAAPKPETSKLVVKVVDEDSKPVTGATVAFEGPENGEKLTDAEGKVQRDMELGNYNLNVQMEGYLRKAKPINMEKDSLTDVEIKLTPKPTKASVIIKNKRIVIKKKIHFNTGSATIMEDSNVLLDEIADVLISNPAVKKVQIQGHTDNTGKRSYNMKLSDGRAASVLNYLVQAGVDEARLQSKGFGPTKPIAPNITKKGRSRNRRVEFHIIERAEETPTQ